MLGVEIAETGRAVVEAVFAERTDAPLAAGVIAVGQVIFGF